MNPVKREQRIAALILKKRLEGLNKAEEDFLLQWRKENHEHEQLYERLYAKDFSDDLVRYRKLDAKRALSVYYKRYSSTSVHRYGIISLINKYWAVAAVVTLFIGVALFLSRSNGKSIYSEEVVHGSSKAILVLSEGKTIDLVANKDQIVVNEQLRVSNTGKELRYESDKTQEVCEALQYNELIIPRGGEYTLVLADGTKVWLNAQTRLKYPVTFDSDRRDVYLEGEAYFEVAKDSLRPFHVNVNQIDVEVLGTSFNVRGYADEQTIETVLEKGCVRIKADVKSVVLNPGDRAVYADGQINVGQVKTELYTAWHQGRYIFENEPLENILKLFSRWYDIEIFYMNEAVKSVTISGDVKRYDEISTLLEAVEIAGGVSCKLNGRTLVVGGY